MSTSARIGRCRMRLNAIQQVRPTPQRAKRGQKPDGRSGIPAEQLCLGCGNQSTLPLDPDHVAFPLHGRMEAQLPEILKHCLGVVGKKHVFQRAWPIRQCGEDQRPVGQALGSRRREAQRKGRGNRFNLQVAHVAASIVGTSGASMRPNRSALARCGAWDSRSCRQDWSLS